MDAVGDVIQSADGRSWWRIVGETLVQTVGRDGKTFAYTAVKVEPVASRSATE